MSSKIIELTNAMPDKEFEALLDFIPTMQDNDWIALDGDDPTSKFWNKREAVVPYELVTSLQESVFELKLNANSFSGMNKLQRLFNTEKIGPTADNTYEDYLKISLIFFLNDFSGAKIEFPHLRYSVKAKPNKIVAYPAGELYTIHGPTSGGGPLYFMPIYAH